jgi:diguanylate cyclase
MDSLDRNDLGQIIDTLSQGLIVLDRNLRVRYWNRWMAQHSGLKWEDVAGREIVAIYPVLKEKGFPWKAKSVFSLGNFSFFSQRLHQSIFPLQASRYLEAGFEEMQQNVVIAPLRGTDGRVEQVAVSIIDNTDAAINRKRLEETTEKLEEATRTDHLTGVANRRHLLERLKDELARHSRTGQTLSLAILDLDHFKQVNDTYGHLGGDFVLAQTAERFSSQIRPYDLIGRYGGEEFCIVLPRADIETAATVLERIRSDLADGEFTWEENRIRVTVSIGVASTEGQGQITAKGLLHDADEALYRAKNAGRNRVVACRPDNS